MEAQTLDQGRGLGQDDFDWVSSDWVLLGAELRKARGRLEERLKDCVEYKRLKECDEAIAKVNSQILRLKHHPGAGGPMSCE